MGTGRHGTGDIGRVVERGEHYHADGGHVGTNPFECLEAVFAGHADVKQHDVGLQFAGELDGLLTAGGFADNLHLRTREQAHEAPSHHLMIIGND